MYLMIYVPMFSILIKKNKPVGEPIRVWIAVNYEEASALWLFALKNF
jgi:hypothetical protein